MRGKISRLSAAEHVAEAQNALYVAASDPPSWLSDQERQVKLDAAGVDAGVAAAQTLAEISATLKDIRDSLHKAGH